MSHFLKFLTLFLTTALLTSGLLPLRATDVIVTGSGGSEAYSSRFENWTSRLSAVLVGALGRPESELTVFSSGQTNSKARTRPAELDQLRAFFEDLAKRHDRNQDLYLYLIGHGSHLRDVSKFQLPGPDLTADELDQWLDRIPARRIIVIHGGSSSAGFINRLSGPNRIICSATKSIGEINAPEFMEFFIRSLEDESADRNRDQRISILETAQQAAALTEAWYMNNGLLASEHAILDDNGDGLGTRLYPPDPNAPQETTPKDGALAATSFLRSFRFPEKTPAPLVKEYLNLMQQVEALTAKKKSLATNEYYRQLEDLLLKAARLHKKIRSYEASD